MAHRSNRRGAQGAGRALVLCAALLALLTPAAAASETSAWAAGARQQTQGAQQTDAARRTETAQQTDAAQRTPFETVAPQSGLDFPVCALAAPREAEGTVPLFRQASEDSEVLMEYYSGARLTALHPAGGGFWRVQAGEKGASIAGYMRADDLRLGAGAQREVSIGYMELRFNREAPVYAYCDTGAKVIGTCDTEHTYYAMSRTDGKWVQLFLPPLLHAFEQEGRASAGFVYMETGLGRGYFHTLDNGYDRAAWTVDPIAGEMSERGAIEFAIDRLASLSDRDLEQYLSLTEADGASDAFFDGESLRAMNSGATLQWNGYSYWWHIFFWEDGVPGLMWLQTHDTDGDGEEPVYYTFFTLDDARRSDFTL